ncbi:hypothetical protein CK203_053632 [Vitis vinifera]|uniref:Uncharacterized protein n=1 Tax=Vitis vinifera TaxID=29760 RepID=A0A438GJJ8_VITVI|nr:hypothetical protein CK203_053632 [Vitis vinifera]
MKMKVLLGFYLWVMLVVVVTGTAFMLPAFSTISTSSSTPARCAGLIWLASLKENLPLLFLVQVGNSCLDPWAALDVVVPFASHIHKIGAASIDLRAQIFKIPLFRTFLQHKEWELCAKENIKRLEPRPTQTLPRSFKQALRHMKNENGRFGVGQNSLWLLISLCHGVLNLAVWLLVQLEPDMNYPMMGSRMKGARSIRKLELGSYKPSTEQRKSNPGNLNLEDYHPIDPSPSSRAAITSGPIEHGTPIIPYIPNVPPPCPPKQDGGSSPPV